MARSFNGEIKHRKKTNKRYCSKHKEFDFEEKIDYEKIQRQKFSNCL